MLGKTPLAMLALCSLLLLSPVVSACPDEGDAPEGDGPGGKPTIQWPDGLPPCVTIGIPPTIEWNCTS